MLKMGFLASTAFYPSILHNDHIIEKYFNSLDKIFKIISECENQRKDIFKLLDGPVCHSGFERLN